VSLWYNATELSEEGKMEKLKKFLKTKTGIASLGVGSASIWAYLDPEFLMFLKRLIEALCSAHG
jgi:hypothetical protein